MCLLYCGFQSGDVLLAAQVRFLYDWSCWSDQEYKEVGETCQFGRQPLGASLDATAMDWTYRALSASTAPQHQEGLAASSSYSSRTNVRWRSAALRAFWASRAITASKIAWCCVNS
jgi:hypothetical protein